jgi:hypothetical protein
MWGANHNDEVDDLRLSGTDSLRSSDAGLRALGDKVSESLYSSMTKEELIQLG